MRQIPFRRIAAFLLGAGVLAVLIVVLAFVSVDHHVSMAGHRTGTLSQ